MTQEDRQSQRQRLAYWNEEEQQDWLTEITGFNIEARYDDFKQSFHRRATEEYTTVWHDRCSNLFAWLEGRLR